MQGVWGLELFPLAMFFSRKYVARRMLLAERGYPCGLAPLDIGIFGIEYVACAGEVNDAVGGLFNQEPVCGKRPKTHGGFVHAYALRRCLS